MVKKSQTGVAGYLNTLHIDWFLLVLVLILISLGYVMMVSSSLHLGMKLTGNSWHYPIRQGIHIIVGIILGMLVMIVPLKFWERYSTSLFLIGMGLLILVLIPGFGVKVNGSLRWLSVFGLRIQISEMMKLCAVIYIAGYVTRHQQRIQMAAFSLLRPLCLFSVACFLLLLEPDFGSAVVLITIALAVMYLSGAKLWQFAVLISVVIVLGVTLILSSQYRMDRVTSFLDPWQDAQNTGFQLVQALIAFGNGEVFGVGLGSGIQKIFYLPEAHTDFLFSVLAEELGLVGVTGVIILFTLLVVRAFAIGAEAEKIGLRFAAFIAYGLGVWFSFQAFINMGVNMGILPTKGLTLPFMSYGGGSMVVMCVAVALLFRVYSEVAEKIASIPKAKREWINV